ncbi:MAG: cytochrome c biogenesis protein CcsA [Planctomycetes bacterium]|nr:cytochrome c biogenesis protein CcsA [Planctomycetota bacterium]
MNLAKPTLLRTLARRAVAAALGLIGPAIGATVGAALGIPSAQAAAQETAAPQGEPVDEHAGHDHANEPHDAPPEVRRAAPWDPEIVALFGELPILEQGRVKPLSTFAGFKLLQLNGTRTLRMVDDRGTPDQKDDDVEVKLSPTEWLLDCLFFPEASRRHPCFQLQTWEVLDAIGVERIDGRKKRDRYSYLELEPGRPQLFARARAMMSDPVKREAKNRSYLDEQLMQLAMKMNQYEGLLGALVFAQQEFLEMPAGAQLADLLGDGKTTRFSRLLEHSAALTERAASGVDEATRTGAQRMLRLAQQMADFASALTLFPPDAKPAPLVKTTMYNSGPAEKRPGGSEEEEWLTLGALEQRVAAGDAELLALHLPAIVGFEDAFAARNDPPRMKAALQQVRDTLVRTATGREQYAKIGSEISYYEADLFFRALVLYVICFVLVAVGWLLRADHKLNRALPWLLFVPLALHVAAIAWRGYLRARPPVSTLYETIPFITAAIVLVALVIELIDRRRIGVVFAAVLGAAGLFLTQRYEAKEAFDKGVDTMPQLVAVLDTNFWLSTHVTSVTIGYAAGLLAALPGIVFILGKLFGLRRGDADFYRALTRMTYGVLCFGLLFSVVGTILGGVWANDSWGRFWGWDPKENGALMICLWELAILHGRMGGYLRDIGVCTAAVFGASIVVFSWFHVNQLGVGLHSYGATDGVSFWLWTTYGGIALVVLAGLWLAMEARAARKASTSNAVGPAKVAGFETD